MEKEFLDWIRQANGLLLEAYRRQAQECKLCWEKGELRFEALITSGWELIKAVPLESTQYLHLFQLATQMIDDGGYFQIRVPEVESEPTVAYRINFLTGIAASECAVKLILEKTDPKVKITAMEEVDPMDDDLLDSEYIN